MGTWGTGLYSNDLACDVKDELNDVFSVKSPQEGVEILKNEYLREIDEDDFDELANFWYALGDFMWNKGILTQEVKDTCLNLLAENAGLNLWIEEGKKSDIKERKMVLYKLKNKLDSQMPEKKKIKSSCSKSRYNIGDILAVKPNTKLVGHIKNGANYQEIPYFSTENFRDIFNYFNARQGKKIVISLAENYKPIVNMDNYFLLICVEKVRYSKNKLLPEMYEEVPYFLFLDFYRCDIKTQLYDLSKLNFLKIIDDFNNIKYITTDGCKDYCFDKPIKISNNRTLIDKYELIKKEVENTGRATYFSFLESYELFNNPLIKVDTLLR